MKKRLIVAFSILITLALVFVAAKPDMIATLKNDNIYKIHADYIIYDTEDTLIQKADTIVSGEVLDTFSEQYNLNISETKETDPINVVYTIANIKISEVIKGQYQVGDIIQVKQFGGEYKGKNYVEEQTKQFEKNTKGLFFLQTYESGTPASLINPIQGHVKFMDNKVKLHEENKLFKNIVNVKEIKTLVKEIVKE